MARQFYFIVVCLCVLLVLTDVRGQRRRKGRRRRPGSLAVDHLNIGDRPVILFNFICGVVITGSCNQTSVIDLMYA